MLWREFENYKRIWHERPPRLGILVRGRGRRPQISGYDKHAVGLQVQPHGPRAVLRSLNFPTSIMRELGRELEGLLEQLGSAHQTTFNANWTCLDVVAVEVINPAPLTTEPELSKMALLAVGALKFV